MKMSYEQLKQYVASVVTAGKISIADFNVTRNNSVGLLDKIGKIVTLDTDFETDKLNIFDGEYLSFGKSIEEWQEDLIMVVDEKPNGETAMAPHDPTYRPVFYSYSVGKKHIPTTIRNNDIERAVHFEEQFVTIVAMKYKRLSDSMAQYRYSVKREMIAKLYAICVANDLAIGGAIESEWSSAESANWSSEFGEDGVSGKYVVNVLPDSLTDKSLAGKYILVKNISSQSTLNLVQLIEQSYLIKLDLVTEIAKPVDDTTGEAFIEQVKKDVEIARDSSEGHSLNGNSLGATEGLVLILKQGIMPSVEVKTWAGAFQKEDVALPTEVIVVKDFGSAPKEVYGLLCDKRGMRLHNTYNATRENANGEGDFLNIFRHTEDTAYISRNTFVKFYKEPTE